MDVLLTVNIIMLDVNLPGVSIILSFIQIKFNLPYLHPYFFNCTGENSSTALLLDLKLAVLHVYLTFVGGRC